MLKKTPIAREISLQNHGDTALNQKQFANFKVIYGPRRGPVARFN